jgi:hypothetical protein
MSAHGQFLAACLIFSPRAAQADSNAEHGDSLSSSVGRSVPEPSVVLRILPAATVVSSQRRGITLANNPVHVKVGDPKSVRALPRQSVARPEATEGPSDEYQNS